MTVLKAAFRERLPPPLWGRLAAAKRAATRLPDDVAWHISAKGQKSRQRLRALRDKYLSERCFIIGNGPSLRETKMSLLANEYTFGLNRIYLLFDELGFTSTFHVVCNPLVVQQWAHEIAELQPSVRPTATRWSWPPRHRVGDSAVRKCG